VSLGAHSAWYGFRRRRARAPRETGSCVLVIGVLRLRISFASRTIFFAQRVQGNFGEGIQRSEESAGAILKSKADPLCRVTGPRMNPSVDVGCPPRPFRHLRMAQRCTPDPSSSRAPVHSALVQISVTRQHQPRRPAFNSDARQIPGAWQVPKRK
jgi:hypothetical protein